LTKTVDNTSSMALPRRLVAEALGTMVLVATVVGSGIMAARLTGDLAIQLLGNTLPTGAILIVLVTVFGPVSGAHFNPAVSLVFALRRELPWPDFAPYALAQVVGGLLGTIIAHLMFSLPALQIGDRSRNGGAIWLSEAVATFTLVLAILGTLNAKREAVPVIVGLTITATYWFTASTSFANPAVTLARGFTQSFAGIALADVPAFVLMQVIGALGGMALAGFVFGRFERTNE
jgi:glycerol uptake facilitator-like aquaporin